MENETKTQPTLFETNSAIDAKEKVLLYALGDFQKRGFELIGRKLPLDRLLGAFKRGFEHFGIAETGDREIAETLRKMGAKIEEVPVYVAKHPYRVTIYQELADKSLVF